jgi:hypothetical protein
MFPQIRYYSVQVLLVICLVLSRPAQGHALVPQQLPRRNYTLAPPRPYALEEDKLHECIHDAPHVQSLLSKDLARSAMLMANHPSTAQHQFRAAQASTPESIRIFVSTQDLETPSQYCSNAGQSRPDFTGMYLTCTANEVLTAAKKDLLLNQLLPTALARLTSRIKVNRYTSNLVVSRQACSYFTIPDSHSTTGVPDADFVLYVASGPISGTATLAWAGSCQSDSTTGRPIVGRVNIDPEHLDFSSAAGYEQQIDTVVHEMMHALGFSSAMFAIPSRYGTTTRRGKPVKQLVTNGIVAEARDFTGCASLDGVELEDEGTGGSVGSHLERRLYKDELMTAAGGTQLSRLSLKMLEDLAVGYTVDLSTAEQMTWGRLTGCGFHTEPCNTTLGGRDTYFCFDETAGATFCTRSRDGIGPCPMTTGTTPSGETTSNISRTRRRAGPRSSWTLARTCKRMRTAYAPTRHIPQPTMRSITGTPSVRTHAAYGPPLISLNPATAAQQLCRRLSMREDPLRRRQHAPAAAGPLAAVGELPGRRHGGRHRDPWLCWCGCVPGGQRYMWRSHNCQPHASSNSNNAVPATPSQQAVGRQPLGYTFDRNGCPSHSPDGFVPR